MSKPSSFISEAHAIVDIDVQYIEWSLTQEEAQRIQETITHTRVMMRKLTEEDHRRLVPVRMVFWAPGVKLVGTPPSANEPWADERLEGVPEEFSYTAELESCPLEFEEALLAEERADQLFYYRADCATLNVMQDRIYVAAYEKHGSVLITSDNISEDWLKEVAHG